MPKQKRGPLQAHEKVTNTQLMVCIGHTDAAFIEPMELDKLGDKVSTRMLRQQERVARLHSSKSIERQNPLSIGAELAPHSA